MSADTYREMSVESLIPKIQSLPVLPQVAMRITERMQAPNATLQEISSLIKSDIGLSTKVLRLANSSYYSIPGGVSDVPKALQYLGFTTIAQIVLTTSIFGAFKTQGLRDFPLSQFWIHCFAVGQLAEVAARTLQHESPSDAFIGGLMHDVGKLILLELAPDQLAKIVHFADEHQVSFLKAEADLGFQNHITLGVELAKYWKLPTPVLLAIEGHHGNHTSPDALLIEWADTWVNVKKIGNSGNRSPDLEALLTDLSKKLGLSPKSVQSIETHFHKEFEKAGAILSGH